jgi:hypothetical protein
MVPILGIATTAYAQTEDEDEDLSDIESAIADDTAASQPAPASTSNAALKALLNPDISVILDVAAAWFSDHDAAIQTGGHDPTGNGFNLQALEMSFAKSVDPYFRFDSHLVFGPDGFELEEAYATTLALPHALQVRAGQFLTQFGRLNTTHPHAWDFIDQPIAIGRYLGGDGNRNLGVEVSYLTPLPFYTMLIGSIGQDPEIVVERVDDLQKTVAAKQFFELSDDWSLLTGQSFATANNDLGIDNRTDTYGVDLYLKWRPISYASYQQVALQTEWMYQRVQDGSDRIGNVGGYAYLLWRFARRWATAGRYEYESSDEHHRGTADLTFWPTEFSRLRAQGSYDGTVWAAFLGLEVVVGAHGSHVF